MPDLQSELSKLASAWDNHEQIIRTPQKTQPETTKEKTMNYTHTGVLTHDTFNLIKDNAYMFTPASAADFLETQGHKNNSAHAIITQMRKNKMVLINNAGQLYTEMDAYKPFRNPYSVIKKLIKKNPKVKKEPKAAGLAALKAGTTQSNPTPAPAAPTQLTAQAVLKTLNVGEAYALYVELGKMFGGAK